MTLKQISEISLVLAVGLLTANRFFIKSLRWRRRIAGYDNCRRYTKDVTRCDRKPVESNILLSNIVLINILGKIKWTCIKVKILTTDETLSQLLSGRAVVCAYTAAPKWRRRPKSRIVSEGDSARFDCSAYGVPMPTITWLINGHDANGIRVSTLLISEMT